ncbi:Tetratricopeptide repeat-containing protein [Spirosomataceae bacterium TFI 002]|nr:Tetratricopeptide repeat-containing protein [Spirosomataceae bacterium TFI 002]
MQTVHLINKTIRLLSLFSIVCFALISCSSGSGGKDSLPRFTVLNGDSLQYFAVNYLDEELSKSSSSAVDFYKRARAKFQTGLTEKALEDIYIAANKDGDNPDILLLQARIQYSLGIFDKAAKSADLAESLGNESKELFVLKALLNSRDGNLNVANDYIKNALLKAPFSGDVWLTKGKISSQAGSQEEAMSDWKRAILLNPLEFEAYQILIDEYIKLEKVDSALLYNEKAISKFKHNVDLEINKAAILEQVGALDSAVAVYSNIVRKYPSRLDVLTSLGNTYFKNKNYSSAYVTYRKVLDKLPTNANLYYLAGLSKEKMGDYNTAQELYILASAKDSTDGKYNQAYRRVEYIIESSVRRRINQRAKATKKEEEAPILRRKVFSVEPLEKKTEIKTN